MSKILNVKYFGADFHLHFGEIEYDGGAISAVRSYSESAPDGCDMLIPGLVDIHTHGAMGYDFSSAQADAIPAMADYLAKNGITSFSPSLVTLPEDTLLKCGGLAREYRSRGNSGARLAGITLEGVFFSPEKKGAHDERYLLPPDVGLYERLQSASDGLVRLVCVAPELPGAIEFIREISRDITVSAAHTDCDYDEAGRGFDAGISHVTHLYNAMRPMHHRAPGLIPAAAERPGVTAELIADGIHVHPSMIRAAYRLFGAERLCLVSDAIAACGMPDGEYRLGDELIFLNKGSARLSDGTLAGSASNLFSCMKNAVSFGIPLEDAIRMASFNPARKIGLSAGVIASGYPADMLLCGDDLTLKAVYIGGRKRDA